MPITAIAAARAGCHVLIEKPLEISTARIDALIGEVTRAGVTLGVFFQDRLKPDVVEMKRRIDAGGIGTPLLATGEVKWFRPREYYCLVAVARHMGARRRRRADEPGHSHRRPAVASAWSGRCPCRA